jgi:hypothetical protein
MQEERDLLKIAEVCNLPSDIAVCFLTGKPPLLVKLVPYFSPMFQIPRRMDVWCKCLRFAFFSVLLSFFVSIALFARWDEADKRSPIQQKQQPKQAVQQPHWVWTPQGWQLVGGK